MRPKKGEIFIHKNLTLEAFKTKEYEEIVGSGNVSENVRNFIAGEVEKYRNEQKKEEALHCNRLNLPFSSSSSSLNSDNNVIENRDKYLYELYDKDLKEKSYSILKNCYDVGYILEIVKTLQNIKEQFIEKSRHLQGQREYIKFGVMMVNR